MPGIKFVTICDGVGCGNPEWFVIKNNILYHFASNLLDTEICEKILSTFKFTDNSLEGANSLYNLDCAENPNDFQAKYSWYGKFKGQIIEGWELDAVCYNQELNRAVYLKSKIDYENYKFDINRKIYGQSQLGIYNISQDTFDKAPIKNLGFYEGCGIIKEWQKNNSIIYQ